MLDTVCTRTEETESPATGVCVLGGGGRGVESGSLGPDPEFGFGGPVLILFQ